MTDASAEAIDLAKAIARALDADGLLEPDGLLATEIAAEAITPLVDQGLREARAAGARDVVEVASSVRRRAPSARRQT